MDKKYLILLAGLLVASAVSAEQPAQIADKSVHPVTEAVKRQANTPSTSATYDRPLPNGHVINVNTMWKQPALQPVGAVEEPTKVPSAISQHNNPPSARTVLRKEESYSRGDLPREAIKQEGKDVFLESKANEINIEYKREQLQREDVGSSQSNGVEQSANQQLLQQVDCISRGATEVCHTGAL